MFFHCRFLGGGRGGLPCFSGMVTHIRIWVTSGFLPTGLLQADIGAGLRSAV